MSDCEELVGCAYNELVPLLLNGMAQKKHIFEITKKVILCNPLV